MNLFKSSTVKTKALTLLISLGLILPSGVSAKNSEEVITLEPVIHAEHSEPFSDYLKNPENWGNVIPNPVELQIPERISLADDDFPAKYNSLTDHIDKTGLFPGIKNQGADGDCWAYSAVAALEFSSVLNNGKDFGNANNLLSEHHMVGAMNHTDDMDYQKYTFDFNEGGNYNVALAYLTRDIGGGPVKLADFSEESYKQYAEKKNDYSMIMDIEHDRYVDKAYILTDLYDGSSVLTFDWNNGSPTNFNYSLNQSSIDTIKSGIIKYGAVSAAYYAYSGNNKYYNPDTSAYCISWADMINGDTIEEDNGFKNRVNFYSDGTYKYLSATNHDITIVGWDDNYSYENFKTTPVSGNGIPINGAWIVRNSWGEGYGDNGYEYISYMDPTIGVYAVTYSMSNEDVENIYSYDTLGLSGSLPYEFNSSDANIATVSRYTTTDNYENVTAIGTYIINPGESYEIYINDDAEASSESPSQLSSTEFTNNRLTLLDPETNLETKKVTVNDTGYFTFKLAEPMTVSGDFDVIIKISAAGSNKISIPICSAIQDYSSSFETTEKVNYIAASMYSDGTIVSWNDTKNMMIPKNENGQVVQVALNSNLCVKAYTNSIEAPPSESPSAAPSESPSAAPSESPSAAPSESPSAAPSESPSAAPSESPSAAPSESPSAAPSESPSAAPSESPSVVPEDTFVVHEPTINREKKTISFSIEQIGEANDSTLWIASYTADGMFSGYAKGTLTSSEYDGITMTYHITDCPYVDSAYCKIFIWDKEEFTPYLLNPIYVKLN